MSSTWIHWKFRLWQIRLLDKIWHFSLFFIHVYFLLHYWIDITFSSLFFLNVFFLLTHLILSDLGVKSLRMWFLVIFKEKKNNFLNFFSHSFAFFAFCIHCSPICCFITLFLINMQTGNILCILRIALLVNIWSIYISCNYRK